MRSSQPTPSVPASGPSVPVPPPLRLGKLLGNNAGLILAFVLLSVALAIANPAFLKLSNLTNVARQSIFVGIIGLGMTFVIASGGIDLSVGAVFAICGAVTADLILAGLPVPLALLAALGVGAVVGMINGFLVARLKIADFIATLATMSILRGLIMVYTRGVPFFGVRAESFKWLGQGYIGPIPVPVVLTALLAVVAHVVITRTAFGRHVCAIGSNQEAARLVGVNMQGVKISVYTLTAVLAAFSGILLTSRMEAAMPESGLGYELDVIAATVIGGTSLSGGRGNILGTVIGALIMAIVRNGLNLLDISTFWHQVVIGSIILVAVGLDRLSTIRSRK
ncbi:MAG TPA: ABC transporter permease [Symbiobacteriaceae bacterium]|nr:ABC transporter permease [Symbiobacteriaceae bacterium]